MVGIDTVPLMVSYIHKYSVLNVPLMAESMMYKQRGYNMCDTNKDEYFHEMKRFLLSEYIMYLSSIDR